MDPSAWMNSTVQILKVLIGFSLIICVHELGHFLAARWVGVRVDQFAVGFWKRVCGWRRGEGFTFGGRPQYTAEELVAKGYGETDYRLNILPFGGYVKMMGQDDIIIDEKTDEVRLSDDPRAFINKTVEQRMIVVSAGVIFNLIFAIAAYMLVYMALDRKVMSPVVGQVYPDTPAERAGLMAGDRVVTVDGTKVQSFEDIFKNLIIGGARVPLEVRRGSDVTRLTLEIPEELRGMPYPDRIGILPTRTAEIAPGYNAQRPDDTLKSGDVIKAVNGQPIENSDFLQMTYLASRGAPVMLSVQRKPAAEGAAPATEELRDTPELLLNGSHPQRADADVVDAHGDLLGMRPLSSIAYILPNSPAMKAGLKPGDVVLQWASIPYPRYYEVRSAILSNNRQPLDVVVQRGAERVRLTVTPASRFDLFKRGAPEVGVQFNGGNDGPPIVADVIPNTPAESLRLPRGAELLAIDGAPVATWNEVAVRLLDSAGKTVALRYRSGTDEIETKFAVPSSLINELGLLPWTVIVSIDGETKAKLSNGQEASLPASLVARALLEAKRGQTVKIKYRASPLDTQTHVREFAVRDDNADPWQVRVQFSMRDRAFRTQSETIAPVGNPLTALNEGLRDTRDSLIQLYGMLRVMLTRRETIKHVSGPIGIVNIAVSHAEQGLAELLTFLALLSINLAVLNFLPLPVVDGGLMVFLILEKLRGRPLNIKTQVAITLIGVAGILVCFLFVTIQDLVRIFS